MNAPPFALDLLRSGRSIRRIDGRKVVRKVFGKSHKLFVSAKGDGDLRLYVDVPKDAETPPMRRLSMAGYTVSRVLNKRDDNEFLCVCSSGPGNTLSLSFEGVSVHLIKTLSKRYGDSSTWECVCNALREYKRAHSNAPQEGLNEHEIVGLYGELWVMKNVLRPRLSGWAETLRMWQGYRAESQDFMNDNCILEVKANRAQKAEFIWINGLKQLQSHPGKALLICHLHFDSAEDCGEGLTTIIDTIRKGIRERQLIARFDSALLSARYDDKMAIKWNDLRFCTPEITYYDVLKKDVGFPFPRITRVESPEFIEDLKYKLSRDLIAPFEFEAPGLCSFLNNSEALRAKEKRPR